MERGWTEPEVRVYGTGSWFLLAKMEGRDRAVWVDPGSWAGESHNQLDGQVPGASRTWHPWEGNPAGLGCQTCYPVADPEAEGEEINEPQRPCAPLTSVPPA